MRAAESFHVDVVGAGHLLLGLDEEVNFSVIDFLLLLLLFSLFGLILQLDLIFFLLLLQKPVPLGFLSLFVCGLELKDVISQILQVVDFGAGHFNFDKNKNMHILLQTHNNYYSNINHSQASFFSKELTAKATPCRIVIGCLISRLKMSLPFLPKMKSYLFSFAESTMMQFLMLECVAVPRRLST